MGRIYEEESEQSRLFAWLASYHPEIYATAFAVPNGGYHRISEANRLKQSGVKRGVSDIVILYPHGKYHGLLIEAKRNKISGRSNPKVSHEQISWKDLMNSLGYKADICYGFYEMAQCVKDYLNHEY